MIYIWDRFLKMFEIAVHPRMSCINIHMLRGLKSRGDRVDIQSGSFFSMYYSEPRYEVPV